jgi:hypothetical protein
LFRSTLLLPMDQRFQLHKIQINFSVTTGGIKQELEPGKFLGSYDLIEYLAGKKDDLVAILTGVHILR